jgi:retron-type reverse transcriptase
MQTVWILKCDIRKFFASINQSNLINILNKHIENQDVINLIKIVVTSFESAKTGTGLPLGNLTSQLLVNIYMNEFDQWMKHAIKAKWYIRYADDFVILNKNKEMLSKLIPKISEFLETHLKLALHPNKVFIKTLASGVDFLGWIHFVDHCIPRTTTKKRMQKKLNNSKDETKISYLGMLRKGNTFKLRDKIIL